jgi:hypothetical protein
MGCGACGPCAEGSMASQPHQQKPIESQLIESLRKIVNYNGFVG